MLLVGSEASISPRVSVLGFGVLFGRFMGGG